MLIVGVLCGAMVAGLQASEGEIVDPGMEIISSLKMCLTNGNPEDCKNLIDEAREQDYGADVDKALRDYWLREEAPVDTPADTPEEVSVEPIIAEAVASQE